MLSFYIFKTLAKENNQTILMLTQGIDFAKKNNVIIVMDDRIIVSKICSLGFKTLKGSFHF